MFRLGNLIAPHHILFLQAIQKCRFQPKVFPYGRTSALFTGTKLFSSAALRKIQTHVSETCVPHMMSPPKGPLIAHRSLSSQLHLILYSVWRGLYSLSRSILIPSLLLTAPLPQVRPEPVLRRALDRLISLLHAGSVNYFYACDQLKGMRQDCTVQHLRGGVAVSVYEAHARASLEYGDLAEFNQCQTQLASLYPNPLQHMQQPSQPSLAGSAGSGQPPAAGAAGEGVQGAGTPSSGCVAEFVAYKVLYNAAHAHVGANKTVLLHTLRTAMALAGTSVDADGCIAHALAVRAAAAACDYPAFFALYAATPALGRALLDVIAPKLRWAALNVLVKGYKTSLPVSFVARILGFSPQPPSASIPAAGGGKRPGEGDEGQHRGGQQQQQQRLQGEQPQVPLPGCRHAVFLGKAAAAASEEEGVAACVQWLLAHGAVVEEQGERVKGVVFSFQTCFKCSAQPVVDGHMN